MNTNKTVIITLLLSAIFAIQAAGQEKMPATSESAILVDTIGRANGEDRSARFDSFFNQIQNNPDSKGYVFVYCGKACRYGEVESHLRGIELKTAGRRFPQERLIVLNGGYKGSQEVELWLVPAGACSPSPSPTVNIRNVTFRNKAAALVTPYDCCEDYEQLWRKRKH